MTEESPLVTIGMPTFNREWSLSRVLEAVLAFDYDKKKTRMCFVDNLSTDGTIRILEEFRHAHLKEYEGIRVTEMKSNISHARNAIFEMAEGTDYVFFLDSDIVAPPDVVSRLVSILEQDSGAGIAALPWDRHNSMKRAGVLYRAFTVPPGPHRAYKVGNGCNVVPMRAFRDVGFFNEKLRVHEDGEFCYRMRKKGYSIISDFSSEATHLRGIKVDGRFYLSFMKDSANTYHELLLRGSLLHWLKATSSVAIVLSFLAMAVILSTGSALAFALVLAFSVWLNSSPYAFDDGARVRPVYVLVVGLLLTAATVIICGIMLYGLISGRR